MVGSNMQSTETHNKQAARQTWPTCALPCRMEAAYSVAQFACHESSSQFVLISSACFDSVPTGPIKPTFLRIKSQGRIAAKSSHRRVRQSKELSVLNVRPHVACGPSSEGIDTFEHRHVRRLGVPFRGVCFLAINRIGVDSSCSRSLNLLFLNQHRSRG